ncbi:hypothetical protein CISG_00453 [Coccidioides immitis RMSCC 3703]|uniref:Uncharacterized protein n=1 Tax=Coccidioides immitis RMSCC 3703 TaxID=454286 RepID=A0A0J8QIG2_COCIT|nr:hypothetical protein CISG_00453 [Coccidioides immitis RMSCC 3703]
MPAKAFQREKMARSQTIGDSSPGLLSFFSSALLHISFLALGSITIATAREAGTCCPMVTPSAISLTL